MSHASVEFYETGVRKNFSAAGVLKDYSGRPPSAYPSARLQFALT